MLELIKNKKVNIYTNLNGNNPLIPIATDELFLRQVLTNDECILHIHSLENSAILGTPDTRVPFFKEALNSFYNNNLIPAVRNIGGLGIIADTGVISFSIIMKINPVLPVQKKYADSDQIGNILVIISPVNMIKSPRVLAALADNLFQQMARAFRAVTIGMDSRPFDIIEVIIYKLLSDSP